MENPCGTLITLRHVVTSITLDDGPVYELELPPGDVIILRAVATWFGVTTKTIRNLLSKHRASFAVPVYRNKVRILSQHDVATLRGFFLVGVKRNVPIPLRPDTSHQNCELKS